MQGIVRASYKPAERLVGKQRINRAWLGFSLGFVLAIGYGSLLPFQLDLTAAHVLEKWQGLLSWQIHSLEDVIANLLLYLPLGAMLALASLKIHSLSRRLGTALFAGLTLSLFFELAQGFVSQRFPTLSDVVLNTLGAGLGAVLVSLFRYPYDYGQASLRILWSRSPFTTIALLLTVGLFAYELAPFDFVSDTTSLQLALSQSTPDIAMWQGLFMGKVAVSDWTDYLSGLAWYFILGITWTISLLERRRNHEGIVPTVLTHSLVLALVTESLQLFTAYHVFEPTLIPLRGMTATLGALFVMLLLGEVVGQPHKRQTQSKLAMPLLMVLGLVQIAYLVLSEVDWTSSQLTWGGFGGGVVWPFEAMWRLPISSAVLNALSILVSYGAMTLSLTLTLKRFPGLPFWKLTAIFVALMAFGLETMHHCLTPNKFDPTMPLLAICSVLILRWVFFQIQLPRFVPARPQS